jgi:NTP pyrophosphatase (non-canonical NTP hydrolase)
MKQLIKRNYEAVVKRGLITPETTDLEFLNKLHEELEEVYEEIWHENEPNLREEIGDCLTVCLNWLTHKGIDIEQLLTEIAIKNENRCK